MWTGRGRTSPGAPIPLRHPSSRPAGECAGSENRRLSAASAPGAPVSHQPRRLDAWLARRSTTQTSRAGDRALRRRWPRRRFRSRGAVELSPAVERPARVLAGYRRTAVEHGPPRQDEPGGIEARCPRTLSWRSRRRWRCGCGARAAASSRRRRAGDRPLGRVRLGVGCSPGTGRRAGRRSSGATPSASIGFDL